MAEGGGSGEAPEDGGWLGAERSPVAALTTEAGGFVICSDGATYKLAKDGWREVEPVPGTFRAKQMET